jgi:DNA-binding PadR family transcriptional regulator
VLELAILGSLQDQPLHGYELKKRVADTTGSWAVSFGSLYPALRRLEREGSISVVDPSQVATSAIPSTGSLAGDLAAARQRRAPKPTRRTRKAYEITATGRARLTDLLLDPDTPDDDRAFALKLAFCGSLTPEARLQLLQRRRANLADDLSRARQQARTPRDRYARSLAEHRTQSIERDLEWVDSLIAAEHGSVPERTHGSVPERALGDPDPHPNSWDLGAAAS